MQNLIKIGSVDAALRMSEKNWFGREFLAICYRPSVCRLSSV